MPLDTAPIDPDLLTRLGRVVTLWASAESWISMLLGTLMGAALGASQQVTASMSCATQIKAIRALLSVHAHKEEATRDVVALLDRADDLRSERNELVHGIWNASGRESGTVMVNTVNLDRAEIIRDRLVTIADLDDLAREIETWIEDYASLGAKIGFPRNQGATLSIFIEQP